VQLPRVFTDDEIGRFRQELAGQRSPGAYQPGRWSVSPLNRDPAVTGTMPERIRLRDATLRSVETLPGVVAPAEACAGWSGPASARWSRPGCAAGTRPRCGPRWS